MMNIAIIDDDKTFCDDFEEQIKKLITAIIPTVIMI